ncbi:hypothetical protein HDU85_005977 [Gaertneriomyces sp. JEL0708]|nr:hypothetical protein HDU85_005977 [Gaertneriomyces sp. JEL0708]
MVLRGSRPMLLRRVGCQFRSVFSLSRALFWKRLNDTTATSVKPSKATSTVERKMPPFTRLPSEDEQHVYDRLTQQFLEKLRTTDNAGALWEDYSKLLEGTLEKFHLSILSHQRLLKMLGSVPAPVGSNSKQAAMSKVARLLPQKQKEYAKKALEYAQSNDTVQLNALIDEMYRSGSRIPIRIYNLLLTSYVKNNDLPNALKAFERIRRNSVNVVPTTSSMPLPDSYTYGLVIRAHLRRGSLPTALELFDEMQAANIVPDAALRNTMLHHQGKHQRPSDTPDIDTKTGSTTS